MSDKNYFLIDNFGDTTTEINIRNFPAWMNKNKNEIQKVNMKTLNYKIHWVDDDKNRYKLHRIKEKYVLKKCSKDYFNDKHDLINKFKELEVSVKELNQNLQILENFIKSETFSGADLITGIEGKPPTSDELTNPVVLARFPRV